MMTEKEVLDSLAMFKTALHKLKDQNASLQNSYNELETKYNELVSNSNKDVELNNEKLLTLEKELKAKEAFIADFKAKTLATVRHLVEDNIEVKEQQIKALQDQYEVAATGLDNLSAKYNQLQKEYDDLKSSIATNNELANTSVEINRQLEADNILLKDSNDTKAREINNLNGKIVELQNELRVKKYSDDDLLEKLNAQKAELTAAMPNTDEIVETVRAEYNKKIADLEESLRIKTEALAEKDLKYMTLKNINENLTKTVNKLSDDNKDLREGALTKHNLTVDTGTLYQDATKQIYYMFGHATEKIKDQLVRFITELYNGVDDTHAPYQLMPTEAAALRAQISDKTRNVFIKRLYEMTANDQHLIYDKDGYICSDFTRDYLIEYVTQLNPAAN